MSRGGRIVTLIGQSGSGKSTQMAELAKTDLFRVLPSTTTRLPRPTDLPHEYHYRTADEYAELANIGRLMWDVPAGNNDRYAEDICDIIEALTDDDHVYVNALVPVSAKILVQRYGKALVRSMFIPNPGDDILLARMLQRGDLPEKAMERIRTERDQNWLEQAVAIDGIHIVASQGIAEQHQEILEFALD